MPYVVGGEDYGDGTGREVVIEEFYAAMRKGVKTSTSMINEQVATEYFAELLKQGKDILHISFASACSGTYECMKAAAIKLNLTHANKIYVVDSRAESLGQGLLVWLVNQYRMTHDVEQSYEYALSMRGDINMIFTVDDLKYLAAGGRIKKSHACIANALQIKPLLFVDEEGNLIPKTKVFTRRVALNRIIDKVRAQYSGVSNKIFVAHADCDKDADYVIEKLHETLFVDVEKGNIGPVIGAHSGPGTLAVFFVGKGRRF
jgi:DegV family protein with EDD domain